MAPRRSDRRRDSCRGSWILFRRTSRSTAWASRSASLAPSQSVAVMRTRSNDAVARHGLYGFLAVAQLAQYRFAVLAEHRRGGGAGIPIARGEEGAGPRQY